MTFEDNISKEEFDKFVENHEYSHFLKSYEWGEISVYNGWEPLYVGLKKDKKLVATALLLKKNLPLGYSYFYIPRGYTIDYHDHELVKYFTECINNYTKKFKSLFFKIDPDIKLHTIDKDANVIDGENNYELVDFLKTIGFKRKKLNKFFENEQPRFTFRINLDDKIDERYSKTVHRFIKKANNYNVKTFIGKKENIKDFTRLMTMTEKRQNFYSHKKDYYEKFYDIFSLKNHVLIMLGSINPMEVIDNLKNKLDAENDENKKIEIEKEIDFFKEKGKDDIVVSSYITVLFGNKAWYLYGANDLDYKMTYANYKLFDFQIKTSKEKGKEIFDEFGTVGDPNTTKSIGGLHEFKKKFGGEYLEFIGEFDYIQKPFVNLLYKIVVPIRRRITKRKLHSSLKNN